MDENPLETFFFKRPHRPSSKWRHYFDVYHRHLQRYRGSNLTFLEIGVQGGGSLQMWRDYLGPEARIIGLDVAPDCRAMEAEGFQIFIGDQGDSDFLRAVMAEVGEVDVLLDDGGHRMDQQRVTFDVCFPNIRQDGVYICEDMHTSYWPPYGGELHGADSFVEFLKAKIDELNGWHVWRRPNDLETDFTRSVHGIHFYDSMAVIEKRPVAPPESVGTGG